MDQSKSSNPDAAAEVALPARTFTLEFFVGLFTLVGVVFAGWLAVGLAGIELYSSNKYDITVQFANVSGLKQGASVEISGVQIGTVNSIVLNKEQTKAVVTLHIDRAVPIHDDDIALIRTKGIIGDRYVKISRGASDEVIKSGGKMPEEGESVVDIEDLIGKIVHNMSGGDESGKDKDKDAKK